MSLQPQQMMTCRFKIILPQFITTFLGIVFFVLSVPAQELVGIATQWNDSFAEWEVFTSEEEPDGILTLRWTTRKDWTQWNFTIGEHFGTIRQKWEGDRSQWDVRSGTEIISMRTIWNGDFRQWRISGSGGQYDFVCRYGNTWDEWQLKNGEDFFLVYTHWEGDPREWIIEDGVGEAYSIAEKMAMVFIAVFNSSPLD